VPQGAIEFPASRLHAAPGGGIWNGFVHFAGSRRYSIWARVRATVPVLRVIAAANLAAGQPIAKEEVRLESRDELPSTGLRSLTIEDVAGKLPRSPIHAGDPVRPELLLSRSDVMRGDTVHVDVYVGGAHVQFEGQAQASGAVGSSVPVLNPNTRKRITARVASKGVVTVGTAPKVNP
jgi:flagella basal body P-ring formation protein FlgA